MLKNPILLILFSLSIGLISIVFDIGNSSWYLFQRSGSLITLFGAILGVRSFIRLGINGFGGATPFVKIGKVVGSDEHRKILMELDEESVNAENEDRKDKRSAFIGLIHIFIGTIIWGYGDLLGKLF